MKNLNEQTIVYFQARDHYFWHWAEKGQVIEWLQDETFAYREDIIPILREVAPQGLPPFGAILLLLAACRDNWHEMIEISIRAMDKHLIPEPGTDRFTNIDRLEEIISFLGLVNQLPEDLRSGFSRVHLIKSIFKESAFAVLPDLAPRIIEQFESGFLDDKILQKGSKVTKNVFYREMLAFYYAAANYKSLESLETLIKTGRAEVPEPIEFEVPEEVIEEEKALIDQLLEDPKTSGIAHLAQRLMAAVNIPIHTKGSSDQAYGGISDITNRGSFDRLLLSELAYDDNQLMARLVNNEALYYRHEEPPANLPENRTILVEDSIRMWGSPRHFAIAVGLACLINPKRELQIEAFSLKGEGYELIDLGTKTGILASLNSLTPDLSSLEALMNFIRNPNFSHSSEHILIADEALVSSREFRVNSQEIRQALSYLISINRKGELHFYQFANGRQKQLSKAYFDLPELLSKKPNHKKNSFDDSLPASMNQEVFPMYHPSVNVSLNRKYIRGWYLNDIIGITDDKRVLIWDAGNHKGAIEIMPHIEPGTYFFGRHHLGNKFYILIQKVRDIGIILYEISRTSYGVYEWESYEFEGKSGYISVVEIEDETTLRVFGTSYYSCNISTGEKKQLTYLDRKNKNPDLPYITLDNYLEKDTIKSRINNGYSTIQRIRSIFINQERRFCINKHELQVGSLISKKGEKTTVKLTIYKGDFLEDRAAQVQDIEHLIPESKKLKFRRAVWPDGSLAVFDPRGFVHLKSSDPNLPEITIAMILQKETACWSSDGKFCGSPYLYKPTLVDEIDCDEFNLNYIQPFIDNIL